MALDINAYNATFKAFVEFAEKTQRDGYDSACAKATLAGKRITVSALSLARAILANVKELREAAKGDAGGLQNERIYLVPIKSFVGTLMLARCGQRNMQSLSEALHGADGGCLLQTYRDFESDDYVQYEMHGDDQVMTKMRMSVLAADRIKQLQRFDILVAMAAGQNMENYEMIDEEMFEHGVEHPGYSHDVIEAIGRDFEDIVRADPDAYGPQ